MPEKKRTSNAFYIDVSIYGYPALVIDKKLYVKRDNIYSYHRRLAHDEHILKSSRKYIFKYELARMYLAGEIVE